MDVVVVGSINYDLTIRAEHHPRTGETVMGSGHEGGPGGKGANQAVAAARLGARVAMVGKVGDDDLGARMVTILESEGVGVESVGIEAGTGTGLAVITLDEQGENTIVVSPGANSTLTSEAVRASGSLAEAKVLLAQLEVPLEAVMAGAEATQGIFCLNAAPARELPTELLERVDILIVNRPELAMLTGVMAESPDWASSTARLIQGPGAVVVTLGAEGAVIVDESGTTAVPAPAVDVVDTTGAGDALCGALAAELAAGATLEAAVRTAVTAGAIATTRRGAIPSMPNREEVEALATPD
jgi:ribokinase